MFAFVFPGQGSQSVGMMQPYLEDFPVVQELFATASEVLSYDLTKLVAEGPAEKLNQTEITQPALLVAGVAMWQVWQSVSPLQPSWMAGHSLGEYTALVCAGVLDFSDAVKLVSLRGQFMQAAVAPGEGAMAAIIGLSNDAVVDVCQACSQEGSSVQAANYNSVGQVVISGHASAVEQAMVKAKEAGAKLAKAIPVSVPSHSMLMKPAAEKFAATLADIHFNEAAIPVVNNVDVQVATDAGSIRGALVRQLYSPVRWVETIEAMKSKGVTSLAECGPGKVLAGLIKRIDKSLPVTSFTDVDQMKSFYAELN